MDVHAGRMLAATMTFAALALPGCKTSSEVGRSMLLPPGAQVMDVPEDKTFLMASPVAQPMPKFPAGISRDTDVSVCVEIIVSEAGNTTAVTPLYALPECPLSQPEMDPRFVGSVMDAVKHWQFLAAAVCTFPLGTPKTDNCSGDDVKISPVAIKLSYVFSFKNGGRVTSTKRI